MAILLAGPASSLVMRQTAEDAAARAVRDTTPFFCRKLMLILYLSALCSLPRVSRKVTSSLSLLKMGMRREWNLGGLPAPA